MNTNIETNILMNKAELNEWYMKLASIARELTNKGLSTDEAIEKAPHVYEARQRQFQIKLADKSFKSAIISTIKNKYITKS